jgi:hypothetical protein
MNLTPIRYNTDHGMYECIRKANANLVWDLVDNTIYYKLFDDIRDRIELDITHNSYFTIHDFLRERYESK